MTWFELGAVCTTVAIGAAVQGSVGFGFALITAPILALIDPRLVPGPVLAAVFVLTLLVLGRERRSIDLEGLKWALFGYLPGTLLGALALAVMPERGTSLVFGTFVLIAVYLSAVGLRLRPVRRILVGAGLLAGFMGVTSSINGPPIALVYQDTPGARLRGTLSGYFVASTFVSLASLSLVGRFGSSELRAVLALLPGVCIGFLISRGAARLLDRAYVRPLVLILSAAGALAVILRGVL